MTTIEERYHKAIKEYLKARWWENETQKENAWYQSEEGRKRTTPAEQAEAQQAYEEAQREARDAWDELAEARKAMSIVAAQEAKK